MKKKMLVIALFSVGSLVMTGALCLIYLGSKTGEAFTEYFVAEESDPTVDASVSTEVDQVEADSGILSSERPYYGSGNNDCIKFGAIKQGSTFKGIGICRYTYTNGVCGDYVEFTRDYEAYYWNYDIFKVYADLGDDLVRFAGNNESCGDGWTIGYADMPSGSGKQQLFWGDGGSDKLYTCAAANSSYFWSGADRRADGRDDQDYVYGGYYNDTLWGGVEDDTLRGYNGDDILYGWTDQDTLVGGNGDDTLYGEGDGDELFGEDGEDCLFGGDGVDLLRGGNDCDSLDGGGNYDYCYCSDGEGTIWSCDDYDECDSCASWYDCHLI